MRLPDHDATGEREAVIRVRDNGAGIENGDLVRVFDLFAQGRRGAERGAAGLGIGLTLCKSLVELHGGRVEVRSEGVGLGATFSVVLPRTSEGRPVR